MISSFSIRSPWLEAPICATRVPMLLFDCLICSASSSMWALSLSCFLNWFCCSSKSSRWFYKFLVYCISLFSMSILFNYASFFLSSSMALSLSDSNYFFSFSCIYFCSLCFASISFIKWCWSCRCFSSSLRYMFSIFWIFSRSCSISNSSYSFVFLGRFGYWPCDPEMPAPMPLPWFDPVAAWFNPMPPPDITCCCPFAS